MNSDEINYDPLIRIPSSQGDSLVLDFRACSFLSVFEITELFAICIERPRFRALKVLGTSPAVGYLERANFFYALDLIHGSGQRKPSPRTDLGHRLLELRTYTFKAEFERDTKRIYAMFQNIGLSEETCSLLVSSLLEVVDNSFSHNLGLWPLDIGPLAVLLIQNYPDIQELSLSFCDFGVGFLKTLKPNYHELRTEPQAVHLALMPNTTSRPTHRGGNGLVYLRKNIFNGLRGSLKIRSRQSLVRVRSSGDVQLLREPLPYSCGANVGFRIKYDS